MAATHQGTCAICHRTQKIVSNGMAKHGFKRPQGWHQETSGCWGSHKTPWEVSSEATVRYVSEVIIPALNNQLDFASRVIAGTEKCIRFQPSANVRVVVTQDGQCEQFKKGLLSGDERSTGHDPRFAFELMRSTEKEIPFEEYAAKERALIWQRACAVKHREIKRVIAEIEAELTLQQERVAKWAPGKLVALNMAVA